ncbi:MAG: hypothetical protein WC836_10710 [Desulfobacula sp.]
MRPVFWDIRAIFYTEQRVRTESSKQYQAGQGDIIEISQEAKTLSLVQTRKNGEPLSVEDDIDRNSYSVSVLTWAADAIDAAVNRHESEEKERYSYDSASVGDVPYVKKKQYGLYRSMAEELRKQADSMISDGLRLGPREQARKIIRSEEEGTSVQASGVIRTIDGRSIDFSMNLEMTRKDSSASTEVFQIDPLLINFSGGSIELSDKKISFDINNDGVTENIHQLKPGRGFLALDLDEDGQINNGSELFGPSTGNGFGELALYDKDNNLWIDENDPVYEKLSVWIKDLSGKDTLLKLSEAGIGAIHIKSVNSGFLLKNEENVSAGQLRATGVVIMEDGSAKSIQQVDLIV